MSLFPSLFHHLKSHFHISRLMKSFKKLKQLKRGNKDLVKVNESSLLQDVSILYWSPFQLERPCKDLLNLMAPFPILLRY